MKNSKLRLPQKLLAFALSLALTVTWMIPSSFVFADDEMPADEVNETASVEEAAGEATEVEETTETVVTEETAEEVVYEEVKEGETEEEPAEDEAEFKYDSGSGTAEDPGVISTAETLAAFATEVDNGNHTTDSVKLGADIDLSAYDNWNPIGLESGRSNIFNGSFDGAGYTVKGMKIENYDSSWMNAGLFATLGGSAKVFDLNVDNVNVSVDVPEAAMYARVGAVTGWIVGGSASIENVKTSGTISVSSNGTSVYAAGIAGNMLAGASVVDCSSDVDVSVTENGSSWGMGVGGIAGSSGNSNIIANCAATGDVSLTCEKVAGTIGGIAGMASGVVVNSYVSGSVTYSGAESDAAGAVIGEVGYGTGAQSAECLYYANDSTSLNAVGAIDNEDVTIDTTGMAAADMAGDSFVSTLNANLPAAITAAGRALNKWELSDDQAVPTGEAVVYYNWVSLYNNLGAAVENEADYDAVTSATNFVSNHAGDIPTTIVKSTDAEGTISLTGVLLPASDESAVEIASTGTARAAYYDITDEVTNDNKKYGTDKLTVYLDNTKEGYTWADYSTKLYAVTVSDGTTTVGTVPWVDFYVEGHHTDYVDVALNNGSVHEGVQNGATVNRFAAFYDENGVLKTGEYTVTLYAVGYQPLSATVTVGNVISSEVKVSVKDETTVKISGLPEDMSGATLKVGLPAGKRETQVGDIVEITDGKATLTEGIEIDTTYNFTISSDNYVDVKKKATWTEEAAQTAVEEAEAAVAAAQEKIDALKDDSTAAEVKEAYEALVEAQNAVTEAQEDLTAAQQKKLNDQIEDLTEQLAEAKVVDISNFAVTLDGVEGYSATYTGSAIEPAVAVTGVDADKYTVEYADNTNAGTATVTITANADGYKGSIVKTFTIEKAANGLTVKASTKTAKYAKVKKAKQTVAPLKVSGADGKVTYKKASGSAKLSVNKTTGKVTVKKGTKKGTYKAVIAVTAAGDANHKSVTKKVTVKVKVK